MKSSTVMPSLPFRPVLPFPDGNIDDGDRSMLVYLHRVEGEQTALVGMQFTPRRKRPEFTARPS